jgi:hypothetical protein
VARSPARLRQRPDRCRNAHTDRDVHADPHGHQHAHTDQHPDADGHANRYADGHGDRNSYLDPDRYTATGSHRHAGTLRDTSAH